MPWSWRRFGLHFGIGLAIGISNLPIALGITALFILYELSEDRWLRDRAYIDVQGALGGVIVMAVLRWGLALAGVDLLKLTP